MRGLGRRAGWAALSALLLGAAGGLPARAGTEEPPPRAAEETAPAALAPLPIAIYPIENLSGNEAPLEDLRADLRARLETRGCALVEAAVLDGFLRRHRVRYVGGLPRDVARSLRADLAAGAVLITSLDLYQPSDPPRMAVTARLVSAGDDPRILWMDTAADSGDAAPGFLGLGRITAIGPIREAVLDRITASLAGHLAAAAGPAAAGAPAPSAPVAEGDAARYRPKTLFVSPRAAIETRPIRVAVLPLDDQSNARHAGEVVALQIVRALAASPGIDVIEPGVVRDALLRSRVIQEEGLSLPQSDLVRINLGAEVAVFGEVTQYVEAWAGASEPRVEMLVRVMDTRERQVILSASSRARGDDGVFFFGLGRVPTAHQLASRLVGALVRRTVSSLEGAS